MWSAFIERWEYHPRKRFKKLKFGVLPVVSLRQKLLAILHGACIVLLISSLRVATQAMQPRIVEIWKIEALKRRNVYSSDKHKQKGTSRPTVSMEYCYLIMSVMMLWLAVVISGVQLAQSIDVICEELSGLAVNLDSIGNEIDVLNVVFVCIPLRAAVWVSTLVSQDTAGFLTAKTESKRDPVEVEKCKGHLCDLVDEERSQEGFTGGHVYASYQHSLLMQAGDVETNPGPTGREEYEKSLRKLSEWSRDKLTSTLDWDNDTDRDLNMFAEEMKDWDHSSLQSFLDLTSDGILETFQGLRLRREMLVRWKTSRKAEASYQSLLQACLRTETWKFAATICEALHSRETEMLQDVKCRTTFHATMEQNCVQYDEIKGVLLGATGSGSALATRVGASFENGTHEFYGHIRIVVEANGRVVHLSDAEFKEKILKSARDNVRCDPDQDCELLLPDNGIEKDLFVRMFTLGNDSRSFDGQTVIDILDGSGHRELPSHILQNCDFCLLVVDLSQCLDDHPLINESEAKLLNGLTNEQILCRNLRMIASQAQMVNLGFVGFKCGSVHECTESVKEKNERLKEIVASFNLEDHVIFSNDKEYISIIDATNCDDETIFQIVGDVLESCPSDTSSFPLSYYALKLNLEQKVHDTHEIVFSTEEIFTEMFKIHNLSRSLFDEALIFLHYNNDIVYYHKEFPSKVVADYGAILKKHDEIMKHHSQLLMNNADMQLELDNTWMRFLKYSLVTEECLKKFGEDVVPHDLLRIFELLGTVFYVQKDEYFMPSLFNCDEKAVAKEKQPGCHFIVKIWGNNIQFNNFFTKLSCHLILDYDTREIVLDPNQEKQHFLLTQNSINFNFGHRFPGKVIIYDIFRPFFLLSAILEESISGNSHLVEDISSRIESSLRACITDGQTAEVMFLCEIHKSTSLHAAKNDGHKLQCSMLETSEGLLLTQEQKIWLPLNNMSITCITNSHPSFTADNMQPSEPRLYYEEITLSNFIIDEQPELKEIPAFAIHCMEVGCTENFKLRLTEEQKQLKIEVTAVGEKNGQCSTSIDHDNFTIAFKPLEADEYTVTVKIDGEVIYQEYVYVAAPPVTFVTYSKQSYSPPAIASSCSVRSTSPERPISVHSYSPPAVAPLQIYSPPATACSVSVQSYSPPASGCSVSVRSYSPPASACSVSVRSYSPPATACSVSVRSYSPPACMQEPILVRSPVVTPQSYSPFAVETLSSSYADQKFVAVMVESTVTFNVRLTEDQQKAKIEVVAVGEENGRSNSSFSQDEDGNCVVAFEPLDIDNYTVALTVDGVKIRQGLYSVCSYGKIEMPVQPQEEQGCFLKLEVIESGGQTVILDNIAVLESQKHSDISTTAFGEKTGYCYPVRFTDEDGNFYVAISLEKPDKYVITVTIDNDEIGNSPYYYEVQDAAESEKILGYSNSMDMMELYSWLVFQEKMPKKDCEILKGMKINGKMLETISETEGWADLGISQEGVDVLAELTQKNTNAEVASSTVVQESELDDLLKDINGSKELGYDEKNEVFQIINCLPQEDTIKLGLNLGFSLNKLMSMPSLHENLIDDWLTEETRGNLMPTWQSLAKSLAMTGRNDLIEQIKQDHPSDEIVEERMKREYIAAYKKAIKQKCTVDIRPVRFNYIGLPRSGKTTFRKRMMEEYLNIASAMAAGKLEQPSTGLAEDGGQLLIKSVSTEMGLVSSKVWSALKGNVGEASMLIQYLYQRVKKAAADNSSNPADDQPSTSEVGLPELASKESGGETVNDSVTESAQEQVLRDEDLSMETVAEDIVDSFLPILNEALSTDNFGVFEDLLNDTTLLINTDTGGQAEFLDLQASIVQGPSFNLLFSRLTSPLDAPFTTYFTDKDHQSTAAEKSCLTAEEILFQALASISCFNESFGDEDNEVEDQDATEELPDKIEYSNAPIALAKESKSKIMFVGTFLDELSDPESELRERDSFLKEAIKKTDLYNKDIIQYASAEKGRLILAVDNMHGDQADIDRIREILEKAIKNNFKKIPIPASWLLLNLYIRQEKKRTMTLVECQEYIKEKMLGIDEKELHYALWFLHHSVGVLLYFPAVETLKDRVIFDKQIVFDSISNLIINVFTYNNQNLPERVHQEFWMKGRFSAKFVKKAVKQATVGHASDSLIPLNELLNLLDYLCILTPISATSGEDSEANQLKTYFMPCVLRSARAEELDDPSACDDIAPLFLCYSCGYVPLGLFPSLITYLVASHNGWVMDDAIQVFKNKVFFVVSYDGNRAWITLVMHPRFFKVTIYNISERSPGSLCNKVRNDIENALLEVLKRKGYPSKVKHMLAFECPECPDVLDVSTRSKSQPSLKVGALSFPKDASKQISSSQLDQLASSANEQIDVKRSFSVAPHQKHKERHHCIIESSLKPKDMLCPRLNQQRNSNPRLNPFVELRSCHKIWFQTAKDHIDPQEQQDSDSDAPEDECNETPRFSLKEQKKMFKKHRPLPPPRKGKPDEAVLKEFCEEVQIILQTVNESEYQAAVTFMEPPHDNFKKSVVFPSAGTVIGIFAGHSTALIYTDTGAHAGNYIQDAIGTFPNAKFVIGVGVGYAFSRREHKLGDVLVSKMICDLANFGFNKKGEVVNRGQTIKVNRHLFSAFCRDLDFEDDFEVTEPASSEDDEGRLAKVYSGTLASYAVQMENKKIRDKFQAAIPEVIGGEMEGGQLLNFQTQNKIEGVIVIKGVANYGDGTDYDKWQFTSAMSALTYAHSKLQYYRYQE